MPYYPPPTYNSDPLLPLIWSWRGGTKRNELTDRTHTRIVSFIVLDDHITILPLPITINTWFWFGFTYPLYVTYMDRQKHLRKKPYLLILWFCDNDARQECRHRQLPAGGCLPPDCCSVSSDGQPGVSVQLSAPAPSPLSHSLSNFSQRGTKIMVTCCLRRK